MQASARNALCCMLLYVPKGQKDILTFHEWRLEMPSWSAGLLGAHCVDGRRPPPMLAVVAGTPRVAPASPHWVGELVIKPQPTTPALDTSKWPLLLKNYDKLHVRTGHYTPIPSGYTPLKRPLQEYVRCELVRKLTGTAAAACYMQLHVKAASYGRCATAAGTSACCTRRIAPLASWNRLISCALPSSCQVWCDQPGQALQPLFARGCGLDPSHPARREDRAQRHAGPQG